MKTRQSERPNYKVLHEGVTPRKERIKEKKWSKSSLYEFEVLREEGDRLFVHWKGWPTSYDSYIERVAAVDIPEDAVGSDARQDLHRQLYIQVSSKNYTKFVVVF